MNPISRTIPQRSWRGSQTLDLELLCFLHSWLDTLGLLHPSSRETSADNLLPGSSDLCWKARKAWLGTPKYCLQYCNCSKGKKKRIEGKTLSNQIGTVGLDQSIHLSSLVTHLSQAVLVKKGILSKKITDAYRVKEGILQTEVKYKIITFGLELHHLIKLKGSDQNRYIRGGNPL